MVIDRGPTSQVVSFKPYTNAPVSNWAVEVSITHDEDFLPIVAHFVPPSP